MGCFPKKNKVEPFGPPKAKQRRARPKSESSRGNGCFNAFSAFITSLFFLKRKKTKLVNLNLNQNLKGSMYPDWDSDDDAQSSTSQTPYPRPSPRRQRRRAHFEEVVFQLPGTPDSEEDVNVNDNVHTVQVTVHTHQLPAPNEYRANPEQRTNQEILSEMRESGFVSSGVNVAPGGVAFDIHVTSVRPMTAKGERVQKPPRRLQQLETSQREQEQHRRVMAMRANVKQANAERQRMELEGSRFQKVEKQSHKHQKVADAIAAARAIRQQETSQNIELKAERAKSARSSLRQARLDRVELMKKRREMALKSKQLSLGGHGCKAPDQSKLRLDSSDDSVQKTQ